MFGECLWLHHVVVGAEVVENVDWRCMWLELVLVPLEVLFGLYFDGKALGAADSLGNPDSYSSAFPIPNLF